MFIHFQKIIGSYVVENLTERIKYKPHALKFGKIKKCSMYIFIGNAAYQTYNKKGHKI